MIARVRHALGAWLARGRPGGAMGKQVAHEVHLSIGHGATRGTAAPPTAPVLRISMEPPSFSAQAMEV